MKNGILANHRRAWTVAAVVLVVLVAAAAFFACNPGGARMVPATDYTRLAAKDLEARVAVTGTVETRDNTPVTTRLTGPVRRVDVAVGDPVQEGQVLAEIDTTELQRQLDSQRTALANAEQSGAQQVQAAQDQLAAGQADDTADAESLQQQADAVTQAQNNAYLSRQQAVEQIENLKADIGAGVVRAPVGGVVTAVGAEPGSPAGGALVRIGNPDRLVVRAQVNEADAGKVSNGDEVTFTTPATGTRTYHGTVAAVSTVAAAPPSGEGAAAGAAQRPKPTFPVEIEVTGDTEGLRMGSTAKAQIVTEKTTGAIAVPREAVFDADGGGQAVLVLRPNGTEGESEGDGTYTVTEAAVETGTTTDFEIAVTGKDLHDGDLVVNTAADYHDAIGQTVVPESPEEQQ